MYPWREPYSECMYNKNLAVKTIIATCLIVVDEKTLRLLRKKSALSFDSTD